MMERQSQFLIGGRKATLDAAALEKAAFDCGPRFSATLTLL